MANNIEGYKNNPLLQTTKAPEGWRGTPVDKKGRFLNLFHPFVPKLSEVLRWQFQRNPFKKEKKAEKWMPDISRDESWLDRNDDVIVWLGHSTFYIRINGIRLLTDPVFGDIFFVKRQSHFPVSVQRLLHIDYILLSHDHRDHLDKNSLKILSNQNPQARYLTGLGMKELVQSFTQSKAIEEAGWYQQYNIVKHPLHITFIPARHWSKRGLYDTNQRLWGGFVIETADRCILFGGDSGYDLHYQQIATVFKSFDHAVLGIGAYEPAWFMRPNHQSPSDALKGFAELNAAHFIPMHYGTFDLSDEPLHQPLKDLHAAAATHHLQEKVSILNIGESLSIK